MGPGRRPLAWRAPRAHDDRVGFDGLRGANPQRFAISLETLRAFTASVHGDPIVLPVGPFGAR